MSFGGRGGRDGGRSFGGRGGRDGGRGAGRGGGGRGRGSFDEGPPAEVCGKLPIILKDFHSMHYYKMFYRGRNWCISSCV